MIDQSLRPFGLREGLASAAPATMVIYKDRVEFKNPNVPHGRGPIDPAHFTPYPKNPTLCKFLIQLGRYEELGSGINNVTKYLPLYAVGAGTPSLIEDDMFTTVVPLGPITGEVTAPVAGEVTGEVTGEVGRLIAVMNGEMKRSEVQAALGLKHEDHFRNAYLVPALQSGLIEMTIPGKPKSSKQRYRLSEVGKKMLGKADRKAPHSAK